MEAGQAGAHATKQVEPDVARTWVSMDVLRELEVDRARADRWGKLDRYARGEGFGYFRGDNLDQTTERPRRGDWRPATVREKEA